MLLVGGEGGQLDCHVDRTPLHHSARTKTSSSMGPANTDSRPVLGEKGSLPELDGLTPLRVDLE